MDILKGIGRVFIFVVAGITICTAIFLTIFNRGAVLSYYLLWQIISLAAICSMGNLIYYSKHDLNRKKLKVREVCHFLYINTVVFTSAYLYHWIQPGFFLEWILMFALIVMVYGIVSYVVFRHELQVAEKINRKLKSVQKQEE